MIKTLRLKTFIFNKTNNYFLKNNIQVLSVKAKSNINHQDFLINYYKDLVPTNIRYMDTIKNFKEYNNSRKNNKKDKNIEKKKDK